MTDLGIAAHAYGSNQHWPQFLTATWPCSMLSRCQPAPPHGPSGAQIPAPNSLGMVRGAPCSVNVVCASRALARSHSPWWHSQRRRRASSPAMRTAAGLIQPSCRKRVRHSAGAVELPCVMRCGGAGGCCVVVSAFIYTCPAHRSRHQHQTARASPPESEPEGARAHPAGQSYPQPRRVQRDWRRGLPQLPPGERRHCAAS